MTTEAPFYAFNAEAWYAKYPPEGNPDVYPPGTYLELQADPRQLSLFDEGRDMHKDSATLLNTSIRYVLQLLREMDETREQVKAVWKKLGELKYSKEVVRAAKQLVAAHRSPILKLHKHIEVALADANRLQDLHRILGWPVEPDEDEEADEDAEDPDDHGDAGDQADLFEPPLGKTPLDILVERIDSMDDDEEEETWHRGDCYDESCPGGADPPETPVAANDQQLEREMLSNVEAGMGAQEACEELAAWHGKPLDAIREVWQGLERAGLLEREVTAPGGWRVIWARAKTWHDQVGARIRHHVTSGALKAQVLPVVAKETACTKEAVTERWEELMAAGAIVKDGRQFAWSAVRQEKAVA